MNNIKKLVSILAILSGLLMTGCASSGEGGNPVTTWQNERAFSETISNAYKNNKAVTLNDVTYKSQIKSPALAAPVNALSATSAAIYLSVVRGVDKMSAQNEGRQIYIGIENDVKNGANRKELMAQMTPEQKKAYRDYETEIKRVDQEKTLQTVVLPLIQKIAQEAQKVADLAQNLKNAPEFRKLAGFAAIKAGKEIVADADALASQISDASEGALGFSAASPFAVSSVRSSRAIRSASASLQPCDLYCATSSA